MKVVTDDEWASHCARWRTYAREYAFRSGVQWMEVFISTSLPGPGQESGRADALVGRVEYQPDGSKVYTIY